MADNINQSITDLQAAIWALIDRQAQCCETAGGTKDPPPLSGSDVSIGTEPGDDFPSNDAYSDAKCNAANWIYDGVLGNVTWLSVNHTDVLAGALGAVSGAVLAGLIFSGPVGWAGAIGEAALVGLISLFFSLTFNFTNLLTTLGDGHETAVQALYDANSAQEAQANFIAALDAASPGLDAADPYLLRALLTNNALNNLFRPAGEAATYESPAPVVCTPAVDDCVILKMSGIAPYNTFLLGTIIDTNGGFYEDEDGYHFNGPGSFTVQFPHIGETHDVNYSWRCRGEMYLFAAQDGSIRFTINDVAPGSDSSGAINVFPFPQATGVWDSGSYVDNWAWDEAPGGGMPTNGTITFFNDGAEHVVIRNVEIRIITDPECPDPEA